MSTWKTNSWLNLEANENDRLVKLEVDTGKGRSMKVGRCGTE